MLGAMASGNKTGKRTAGKKTAGKKTAGKKVPSKKTAARKTAVKKTGVKKTGVKKAAVKKTAAKKRASASSRAGALHRAALRHNWDDGVRRLQAIVDDLDCDLGTALLIYWMGAPGFDREFVDVKDAPDWRRPVTKFLRMLEARIVARRFATADILFNPRFDCTTVNPAGHDWTAEYGEVEVKRPIPAALLEPSAPDPAWEARGRAPAKGPGLRLT